MPFTDRAQIHVEGGGGGNGALSFRREPHVPRGGPDGGNGGRGGRVVLVADPQVTDLSRFRHAVHHRGPSGAPGEGKGRHGKAGADLEVAVPPGTRVLRDGHPIAELARPGERVAVARGETEGSATGPSAPPPGRRPGSRSRAPRASRRGSRSS